MTKHDVRRPQPERRWRRDLLAGLPGAVSSVPDGMASSVLAGVSPAHGLYASFAGPIAGGLTTSTRLMVVTTTTAAALAAGSALAGYESGAERDDAMLLLTVLAGGLMVLAGLVGLSRYIRFVSYSVMLGFLTGVSVNMVLGQLPDLAGVDADGPFAAARTWDLLTRLDEVSWPTLATGAAALAVLVLLAPTRLAVVSSLIALVVPTALVLVLGATSVATVDDTGTIPHGLQMPRLPDLGLVSPGLLAGALAIAALVLVQGAGVAEAVPNDDGRSSMRRDFVAQGIGNVASGLFRGQPVGGSVGQTALNVSAGAVSRWGGIWSGLWMAIILVMLSGVVGRVAMPTLAAVLIYAGVGSIHPREVVTVARAGMIPAIAMSATFLAVLVLPVAEAVGIGVVASLLLQLRQDALDLRLVRVRRDASGRLVETPAPVVLEPGEVVVLQAYGSLFYAGARTLHRLLPKPAPEGSAAGAAVVLRLRGRTTLGATFLKLVGDYARTLELAGARLYLSGVDPGLVGRWSSDDTFRRLSGVHIEPATPVLGESTHLAIAAAHAGESG